jgi:hypothetical protein
VKLKVTTSFKHPLLCLPYSLGVNVPEQLGQTGILSDWAFEMVVVVV